MTPTLLAQIIVGLITFAGVCVTAWASIRKSSSDMQNKLDKNIAIMDYKLTTLTDEVRMHNNFAQRIPLMEQRIELNTEAIKKLQSKGG